VVFRVALDGLLSEISSISIISPLSDSILIFVYTLFCPYCKVLNEKAFKENFQKIRLFGNGGGGGVIRLVPLTFIFVKKYFTPSFPHHLQRVSLN
jgi:hypothetical protein